MYEALVYVLEMGPEQRALSSWISLSCGGGVCVGYRKTQKAGKPILSVLFITCFFGTHNSFVK